MTSRIFLTLLALIAVGCASSQSHFDSPQAAADSLVAAVRAKDTAQLKKIFGKDSDAILASGDAVADDQQARKFLAAYDAKHSVQTDVSGNANLIIGPNDWPFPVPIVENDKGKFLFDTPAGEDEILNRRIGRNELDTQQVCLAIVDAQREYAHLRPMGGDFAQYAPKLISDPNMKNGLFWPTNEGEPLSPLGLLVAEASEEGYTARDKHGEPLPYHGYYYRLLTSQGANAPGGTADSSIDGKLIGGFALIAYPPQYGNSGVMTFLTNHDGVLYQRDLGENTASIAKAMTSFDPSSEWKPVPLPAPLP